MAPFAGLDLPAFQGYFPVFRVPAYSACACNG
jgi:hypothetical protein